MTDLLAAARSWWLFIRGGDSIVVIRTEGLADGPRLLIRGPLYRRSEHQFADLARCMAYQAEIESRLIAEGYSLQGMSAERRSGTDRRRSSRGERRR